MGGSVFAVAMMRDERDVVEGAVRHWAGQVDHVIVADNLSTDGSREVLDELAKDLPLTVVGDPEPAYRQSEKMTALAELAASMGATWVMPVDADELPYARDGRPLRELLADADLPAAIRFPIINHLRTALDVDDPDPFLSMVWRQAAPQHLGKVAFRWEPGALIHQGNHNVTLPGSDPDGFLRIGADTGLVALRHFPIRSADHMILKARNGGPAYEALGASNPEEGGHWKGWWAILRDHGEDALREAYRTGWFYPHPDRAGLVRDPAPYRRWAG